MNQTAQMASQPIIDSHVHLWPASTANPEGHAWMKPGDLLTRQLVLDDYYQASDPASTGESAVRGVIYVETDAYYDTPTGDTSLASWAKGPLDEIRFLASIVEGQYGKRNSESLLGIVLWAPLDREPEVFEDWLKLAEETAGPTTWARVVGFRFLLQAIHSEIAFDRLVNGDACIQNLRTLGQRRFTFDVGIDQNAGGTWQLEKCIQSLEKIHNGQLANEKSVFVLNHMCKPDFSASFNPNEAAVKAFETWKSCMRRFAAMPSVYMKLSGTFTELASAAAADRSSPTLTADAIALATSLGPWIDHIIETFGPARIMFGSDWPVCNVDGPGGDQSWKLWRNIVEEVCNRHTLAPELRQRIWSGTAEEAYRLRDLFERGVVE